MSIAWRNASKRFGARTALDALDLQVGTGGELYARPANAYVASLVDAAVSQANSLRSRLCVREPGP